MQFINNIFSDKRKVWAVVLLFVGLIILMMILTLKSSSDSSIVPNEYYDDFSGETVSNPINKEPESYAGQPYDGVIFLGFSELLEKGLTQTQLEAVKLFLSGSKILDTYDNKELSININDIQIERNNTSSGPTKTKISTKLKIGREKISDISILAYSITDVEITVTENGKTVIQSGQINEELLSAD